MAATTSAPLRARLRTCRSLLLTPGSRPDRFSAARAASGDAIIIDLESTVTLADKGRAHAAALAFLRQQPVPNFVRLVRINSPRSPEGVGDLLALSECGDCPDAIVIPECESPDEIRFLIDVLSSTRSMIGIVPMVQLARADFVAERLADAHERVLGLCLGGDDLAADPGAERIGENLLYARSRIVAAAAPTGIATIDVPYFRTDGAGLVGDATASRLLGMTGKAALLAEQLAVINTVFTPPPVQNGDGNQP